MPKRPTDIGSLWMGWNRKYIHGPRFRSPIGLKSIFIRGINPTMPRYKMGITGKDKTVIQSVFRPVDKGEDKYLKKLIEWDGTQYIFPKLRFKPFITIEGQKWSFYAFVFTKAHLARLIKYVSKTHNYRVRKRRVNGITIFSIYRGAKK